MTIVNNDATVTSAENAAPSTPGLESSAAELLLLLVLEDVSAVPLFAVWAMSLGALPSMGWRRCQSFRS